VLPPDGIGWLFWLLLFVLACGGLVSGQDIGEHPLYFGAAQFAGPHLVPSRLRPALSNSTHGTGFWAPFFLFSSFDACTFLCLFGMLNRRFFMLPSFLVPPPPYFCFSMDSSLLNIVPVCFFTYSCSANPVVQPFLLSRTPFCPPFTALFFQNPLYCEVPLPGACCSVLKLSPPPTFTPPLTLSFFALIPPSTP